MAETRHAGQQEDSVLRGHSLKMPWAAAVLAPDSRSARRVLSIVERPYSCSICIGNLLAVLM